MLVVMLTWKSKDLKIQVLVNIFIFDVLSTPIMFSFDLKQTPHYNRLKICPSFIFNPHSNSRTLQVFFALIFMLNSRNFLNKPKGSLNSAEAARIVRLASSHVCKTSNPHQSCSTTTTFWENQWSSTIALKQTLCISTRTDSRIVFFLIITLHIPVVLEALIALTQITPSFIVVLPYTSAQSSRSIAVTVAYSSRLLTKGLAKIQHIVQRAHLYKLIYSHSFFPSRLWLAENPLLHHRVILSVLLLWYSLKERQVIKFCRRKKCYFINLTYWWMWLGY